MPCRSFATPARARAPRALAACAASIGAFAVAASACAPAALPPDGTYVPVEIPGCAPDNDGRITEDELPFVIGAVARVRVGKDVTVDVDGEQGRDDGTGSSARVWDLTRPDPETEELGLLSPEPMDAQWFADRFPGADLAGPLVPSADGRASILGPIAVDEDGVKLLGSASRDEEPDEGQTLMVYDEPVLLYPFPLEVGASATTVATALNARALGIPLAVEDTYTVSVTAHGEVRLPDLILDDALRVTLRLERVPVAGLAVQQVTHVFLNECVGEVARIRSPFVPLDDELADDFTRADEVWRLSF